MKRNILYVVLCLTLTAPALAGCGNDAATPTRENSEASTVTEDVSSDAEASSEEEQESSEEEADLSAESNTTPDSEAITYTPCDIEQLLLDAYEDADAAAEKYADQYLEISGILDECEIDDMANPPGKIVRLEMPFEKSPEHPYVSITAYSWDDDYISLEEFEKATEELSPGDAVKVYATAYYYDSEWKTVTFDLLGIEKQ